MRLHYPACLPAVLATFLVSCASAPAPSKPDNTASAQTAAAVGNGPEHTLQKGMTADEVKRIMGEPAEIKLMPTTSGTAQIWIYRRTTSAPIRQVQVGTRFTNITTIGGDGQAHVASTVEEPVFAQEIDIIDETISLLMFDGKLLEQKASAQKRQEYK